MAVDSGRVENVTFTRSEKTYSINPGLFINNKFVPSVSGKKFASVDPATGKVLVEVYEADSADVDIAVEAAKAAYQVWKDVPPVTKGRLLYKLADLIERETKVLSEIESLDNGKPVSVATSTDLPLTIAHLRYYAGWADKIHGKTMNLGPGMAGYTRHEPFGVVGQIIPWNFPILMMAWKWGPALATGNTIVMKTSEKTPLSALKVCELIEEAGFPPGVINVLSGFGPTAGSAIAKHPDIKKVAFTGSTVVGRLISVMAAQSNLKKVTLELGGKSPNIVFPDADLDKALEWISMGIFFNHGQCCCAGSRVFVHESIYDKFLEGFKAKAEAIQLGDPMNPSTQHGPLVDQLQFDRVVGYIEKGVKEGAKVVTGGARLGTEGYFVIPTVFTEVQDDFVIAKEEIFGPVACVIKFSTVEDVIVRANQTTYGLAAAVHTKSLEIANRMSAALEAGTVWVNCYNMLCDQMPFGGYKGSGIGRELGEYALLEYLQVKSVIMML